ncbi:hypothetical protein [Arthrobacter sp. AQ5-05]|nr:hypothetical protein [Arthrobacter sp. AQ5-05]
MNPARALAGENGTLRGTRDLAKPHYKWIALSNTTLGVLMASINSPSCS